MTDARLSALLAQVAATQVEAAARLSAEIAQVPVVVDGATVSGRISTLLVQVAVSNIVVTPPTGVPVEDIASGGTLHVWSGGVLVPVRLAGS